MFWWLPWSNQSCWLINLLSLTGNAKMIDIPKNYAVRVTSTNGKCQLMIITRSQRGRDGKRADPTMSTVIPVVGILRTVMDFLDPLPTWSPGGGRAADWRSHTVLYSLYPFNGLVMTWWRSPPLQLYVIRQELYRAMERTNSVIHSFSHCAIMTRA